MKIYVTEREVPYKTTKIDPIKSKMDIDGLLAKWQVKDVAWHWDLENNNVYIMFQIDEYIDDRKVTVPVKLEPPRIWNKGRRNRKENINWSVSMRALHWWLKTHLEMNYLMQSDKTTAFLPHVVLNQEKSEDGTVKTTTIRDAIVPKIDDLQALPYLKNIEKPKKQEVKP